MKLTELIQLLNKRSLTELDTDTLERYIKGREKKPFVPGKERPGYQSGRKKRVRSKALDMIKRKRDNDFDIADLDSSDKDDKGFDIDDMVGDDEPDYSPKKKGYAFSCINCKFAAREDCGYSDVTVEETHFHCLKSIIPSFTKDYDEKDQWKKLKYGKYMEDVCPGYKLYKENEDHFIGTPEEDNDVTDGLANYVNVDSSPVLDPDNDYASEPEKMTVPKYVRTYKKWKCHS